MDDVKKYKELHQLRPGFFDTAINTGKGYISVLAAVMALDGCNFMTRALLTLYHVHTYYCDSHAC